MGQEKDGVYFDLVSQPSRAVVLFIRCASLPIEERVVALRKGQHRGKEYLSMNPLGKVPCLKEADGFVLPESAAILKYLAQKHHVAEHWYPGDLRQRTRINAAMDWHHWSIRRGAAGQVFNRVLAPMSGQHGSEEIAEAAVGILKQGLQDLECYWLASTPFMAGDAISIADLLVIMELTQLHMLDGALKGPSMEEQLQAFPSVRGWMQRVQKTTEPHFSAVHQMLHRATANAVKRKQSMQGQSRL